MKKGGMTFAMPSKKLAIGAYARTSQHARTVLPYSRRAEHENESLKPSFHLCSFLLLKTLRLATDKTAAVAQQELLVDWRRHSDGFGYLQQAVGRRGGQHDAKPVHR